MYIKFIPFEPFLSVQFSSFKYIHIVVQSISRALFIYKTETLYLLNNFHFPVPLAATILLSVSVNLTAVGI